MSNAVAHTMEGSRRWPVTSAVRNQVVEELTRLRRDLGSLSRPGLEKGIGSQHLAVAGRRFATLKVVLEHAELVDDRPCVAIGRRVELRDADGQPMTLELVLPGNGDPANGHVSADSPLGDALLGALAGDNVEVSAPAGTWSVTVVSVSALAAGAR
jgi:transcription elongation factor GreA